MRWRARAPTWSRSTTTWLAATPAGTDPSITGWACRWRASATSCGCGMTRTTWTRPTPTRGCNTCGPSASTRRTPPTAPTAPILRLASPTSLIRRDGTYIVKNGEVVIVDEFTGRQMPGRRWSDGLHQAVEAKEGVKAQPENQTLAPITFQNFFRPYRKLAGMAGTVVTET